MFLEQLTPTKKAKRPHQTKGVLSILVLVDF